jgi:hypothetical protein
MKRKRGIMLCFVIAILLPIFFSECNKNNDVKNIIDFDEISEVELDTSSSDIMIVPIKSSIPMDKIRRSFCYNDYTFLLSGSKKMIYCIYKDTVISVLNAVGRGRGEYTYINDLAYSEEEKVIYVNTDIGLYKYEVPSMSFLGSTNIDFSTDGMISLNSKELLVNCSYSLHEGEEAYTGICIVSKETGKVIKQCIDLDYYNTTCYLTHDLERCNDMIILSIGGVKENKVVSWNEETDSVIELFSFGFAPKWKLTRKQTRLLKKKHREFDSEMYSRMVYCDGCHYPTIINSNLAFWCFPFENEIKKKIAVIQKMDKSIYRSFKISGTNITVNPSFVKDNYCVKIIEGSAESLVNAPEKLSLLGKEIYDTKKSQLFNNPIMLFFTIDKNIQ